MNSLHCLKERNIDLEPLGLLPGKANDRCFCTPAEAEIIFRTGVDGVHYCQVKGFDGMVFAVEPMGDARDMVYPVAENVEDFLRLVIACGGEAAVQQSRYWDRAEFDAFLAEYPPTAEQQTVIHRLRTDLGLTPMDDPYGYVSIVQNGFDDRLLRFTEEYYDILGIEPPHEEEYPWVVTYDDGIWSEEPHSNDVGAELTVNIGFRWAERDWVIPSVYVCRRGLVMDVCQSAERGELEAFIDKWNLLENDGKNAFTDEQQEKITRENPLGFGYNAEIVVNGAAIHQKQATGTTWNPCVLDRYHRDTAAEKRVLRHYGLDAECGWSIRRICFPWTNGEAPEIETLSVTLTAEKTDCTAGYFTAEAGDTIAITHPVTGEQYMLKVSEIEQSTLELKNLPDADTEYPLCYTAMVYEVTPPVDKGRMQLRDTCRGDSPIRKGHPNGQIGCAIGVVTLLREDALRHSTASSLTFAPQETVEWRVVFHESEHDPITVQLLQ